MHSLIEENKRLDPAEARKLWDLDLLNLGAAADRVRRRLNPGHRVTFVIDRNINYTNICISGCRFCAFYRPPGAADGYVLDWEALAAKLGTQGPRRQWGSAPGGSQSGLAPELLPGTGDFIRDFGLAVHGFSPPEIFYMAETTLSAWKN